MKALVLDQIDNRTVAAIKAIDLGWTAAAGLQDGGGIGIHDLDRVV